VGPSECRALKNVAAMMFCKTPEKFFPVTRVDIVLFPEGCIENPNNMTEIPPITGPVPDMIRKTLDYIRTNIIKKKIIKQKDRPESLTYFNYPYQAIEEAVVNALYHRDYREREPVEITIEPDKISILSYAGPDRSISIDSIHQAKYLRSRRYRNRRLGDYLKELQLSEGRATGIPTIQDELRRNGSAPAVIETDEFRSYFLIQIPCREGFGNNVVLNGVVDEALCETIKETLNEKTLALFLAIARAQGINRKGLIEKLGFTRITVERYLRQLSSEPLNLIEYLGSKREGVYVLTELGESFFQYLVDKGLDAI
jgi:ATP-dependent DNA helicase RecG